MNAQLPNKANIFTLFFVLILAFIFFYPTFFGGFIFDDWGDLMNAYGTFEDRIRELMPTNGDFRAVTRIFLWICYEFFGVQPLGYHLINFGFHLIIIILIWRLIRKLTNNDFIALTAAFLFSINKAVITPVAWVSASIDQKLLFFALLAVFNYISTARAMIETKKYPIGRVIIFTIIAWLAFKSKLMAWPLPVIYLLVDFTFCNEKKNFKDRIIFSSIRWFKIVSPLIVLTLIYIPNFLKWMGGSIPKSGEYGVSLDILNFIFSWGKYLASTLGLNGYYSFNAALFGCILGGFVFLYSIIYRNKNVLFGMLWFTITIIPVGLFRNHHFDHHLYLPIFGLVLAISAIMFDLALKLNIRKVATKFIAYLGIIIGIYIYGMYPFYKDYGASTADVVNLSDRTLSQIFEIVPTINEPVTFLVYPRPKWSLLNYSAPLNFMYKKFEGITIIVFDNKSDFNSAIQDSRMDTVWYALKYEPTDGSVVLVKKSL